MRLYKNGWFEKFARKERIGDQALCESIKQAEKGLIDADLGNGVIKQRVARPGAGKSGGYRTIILYRTQIRAVFVYGFAKNDKDNLSPEELVEYRSRQTGLGSDGYPDRGGDAGRTMDRGEV